MYVSIVKEVVKRGLPALGAAIQGKRVADSLDPPMSQPVEFDTRRSGFPAYEGAVGDSDVLDPNALQLDPTSPGSIPLNKDLRNAMTTEATTTCQTCPVCGFLVDGKRVFASFRPPWAMDYQDRVVRLVGMNNLAFQMQPDATRIEEWQLPHADIGDELHSGTGYRSIDSFALGPCMLIEAKLGFGGYLKDVYNLRAAEERGTRVPASNAMPAIARGGRCDG